MRSLAVLPLLFGSSAALAAPGPFREAGRFGLGLGAGTSTAGLSGKYFLSSAMSLQGVLGAGYGDSRYYSSAGGGWSSGLGLGVDLLFEMPAFYDEQDLELAWAIGPGLGIWADDDDFAAALSGALGFECNVLAAPIDIVVEYRPRVLLVPDVAFDWFSLSGHIRYYF